MEVNTAKNKMNNHKKDIENINMPKDESSNEIDGAELNSSPTKNNEYKTPNQNITELKDNHTNEIIEKSTKFSTNDNNEIKFYDKDLSKLSPESLITELEHLLKNFAVYKLSKKVFELKNIFQHKLDEDKVIKNKEFISEFGDEAIFNYENPLKQKFNALYLEYKKQLNSYYKQQESIQKNNLKTRLQIIDELKALYQNVNDSNINIFKKFREIRTQWHDAGLIPKENVNDVFKTYYHHLDNFYEYLNLNKELREMDYAHNLEIRYSIINRSKELLVEPNILKAINELHYLNKKWREGATPVTDEHNEITWNEFKTISDKINERKSELTEAKKVEQENNLLLKKEIIAKLNKLNISVENNHRYFQNNIKRVEELREQFFNIGRVPKEENSSTWSEFKTILKEFNVKKNIFYKELKNSQLENLKLKNALLQIALDNKDSEDWELALNLFKKIQQDWRKIGHVPRKVSNKIWDEFQAACNHFFDRYKNKNNEINKEWEINYRKKQEFLESINKTELIKDKEKLFITLKDWNAKWANLGKIPKEKISINKEFTNLINSKLEYLGIKGTDLKSFQTHIVVENIKSSGDERKLNDEIIKIKKQISDLNQEILHLETNLSFFSNAKNDNPLLKNVTLDISQKKENLIILKKQLHELHHIDLNKTETSILNPDITTKTETNEE